MTMDLLTITAADLMTTDLVTADPDETLLAAAKTLMAAGLHCLYIAPLGPHRAPSILTLKDLVQVLADGDPSMLGQLYVRDAMTTPAVTLPAELCVQDCIKLMCMVGVRNVFVTRNGGVVGVLSFSDVLEAALRATGEQLSPV